MLGCGNLALCYVAAGRLDGFLNVATNPWNVFAGKIVLQAVQHSPRGPTGHQFRGQTLDTHQPVRPRRVQRDDPEIPPRYSRLDTALPDTPA